MENSSVSMIQKRLTNTGLANREPLLLSELWRFHFILVVVWRAV